MGKLVHGLCALFIAMSLVASGLLYGQEVFGSIYGTVTDQSGGAVANAKVIITDQNKNTKSEVLTNESGNYNKGQLIPGSYQVEIEAPGFSKVVSANLVVTVDQAARFTPQKRFGAP
ncbi:MAG: carboxypeptidase-like regulatory domain-containing protein [Acidobacteriota bacterium]|nr:carboxypeptidase-like regulatory domain-containing protein [Acidobacteriota bacterium]